MSPRGPAREEAVPPVPLRGPLAPEGERKRVRSEKNGKEEKIFEKGVDKCLYVC